MYLLLLHVKRTCYVVIMQIDPDIKVFRHGRMLHRDYKL